MGPAAGWPPHKRVEQSRSIIRDIFSGNDTFAVSLKHDNRPIGAVALLLSGQGTLSLQAHEAEFGFWLGKPHWGQGIMPEAAQALIRRAFPELGITKIWCSHFADNHQSKRVIEECVFTHLCTCPDFFLSPTQARTLDIYALAQE